MKKIIFALFGGLLFFGSSIAQNNTKYVLLPEMNEKAIYIFYSSTHYDTLILEKIISVPEELDGPDFYQSHHNIGDSIITKISITKRKQITSNYPLFLSPYVQQTQKLYGYVIDSDLNFTTFTVYRNVTEYNTGFLGFILRCLLVFLFTFVIMFLLWSVVTLNSLMAGIIGSIISPPLYLLIAYYSEEDGYGFDQLDFDLQSTTIANIIPIFLAICICWIVIYRFRKNNKK